MKRSHKLIIATVVAIACFLLAGTAVVLVAGWFDHNRIVFHSPIELAFFQPVKVEERKPEIIVEKFVLDYPEPIDTPLKKYICDKWGAFDCKTALAVFTAESGLREDAIHPNNNGTVDFGIGQINSIHFKRPGCSLKEVVDQYKNVDCAFSIWKEQGWTPWVAFNSGSFKTHL
jgi:hypothetical protein